MNSKDLFTQRKKIKVDIVKRLRSPTKFEVEDVQGMCLEAADEIERLRKIEGEWMTLSQDEGKRDREIERLRRELDLVREREAIAAWQELQK